MLLKRKINGKKINVLVLRQEQNKRKILAFKKKDKWKKINVLVLRQEQDKRKILAFKKKDKWNMTSMYFLGIFVVASLVLCGGEMLEV